MVKIWVSSFGLFWHFVRAPLCWSSHQHHKKYDFKDFSFLNPPTCIAFGGGGTKGERKWGNCRGGWRQKGRRKEGFFWCWSLFPLNEVKTLKYLPNLKLLTFAAGRICLHTADRISARFVFSLQSHLWTWRIKSFFFSFICCLKAYLDT